MIVKKQFNILLVCVLSALALSSCLSVDRVLPKSDGLWRIDSNNQREYLNDDLQSDATINTGLGFYRFAEDGTGELLDENQASLATIDWEYRSSPNELTLTEAGISVIYTVLVNDNDAQTWLNITETNASGNTTRRETTLELSRVD